MSSMSTILSVGSSMRTVSDMISVATLKGLMSFGHDIVRGLVVILAMMDFITCLEIVRVSGVVLLFIVVSLGLFVGMLDVCLTNFCRI